MTTRNQTIGRVWGSFSWSSYNGPRKFGSKLIDPADPSKGARVWTPQEQADQCIKNLTGKSLDAFILYRPFGVEPDGTMRFGRRGLLDAAKEDPSIEAHAHVDKSARQFRRVWDAAESERAEFWVYMGQCYSDGLEAASLSTIEQYVDDAIKPFVRAATIKTPSRKGQLPGVIIDVAGAEGPDAASWFVARSLRARGCKVGCEPLANKGSPWLDCGAGGYMGKAIPHVGYFLENGWKHASPSWALSVEDYPGEYLVAVQNDVPTETIVQWLSKGYSVALGIERMTEKGETGESLREAAKALRQAA